jgi:two-component system, response regulator
MILVVEDNVDDSFLLTRELARSNLNREVLVIGDGRDAFDFLLQTSPTPHAVFLDLRLPRLSGVELLQEIRQEPRLYALPVVVMTSSISPEDAEKCARLGVTAFLPKPVSLDLFKKIIGSVDSDRPFLQRSVDPYFLESTPHAAHAAG